MPVAGNGFEQAYNAQATVAPHTRRQAAFDKTASRRDPQTLRSL